MGTYRFWAFMTSDGQYYDHRSPPLVAFDCPCVFLWCCIDLYSINTELDQKYTTIGGLRLFGEHIRKAKTHENPPHTHPTGHIYDENLQIYHQHMYLRDGGTDFIILTTFLAFFHPISMILGYIPKITETQWKSPLTHPTGYINDDNLHVYQQHMYVIDGGINFIILTTFLALFHPISMILGYIPKIIEMGWKKSQEGC